MLCCCSELLVGIDSVQLTIEDLWDYANFPAPLDAAGVTPTEYNSQIKRSNDPHSNNQFNR